MEQLSDSQDQFPYCHNLNRTKNEMYKTAFWNSIGQFVKLVKYHKRFNYYDVETPSGEKGRAFINELSRFCL